MGIIIWDETIKRYVGILILGIVAAFGIVLFELLDNWNVSQRWTIFIAMSWYALDTFIAAYMWHVFKVSKADVPVPTPKLTEVKSIPEEISTDLADSS